MYGTMLRFVGVTSAAVIATAVVIFGAPSSVPDRGHDFRSGKDLERVHGALAPGWTQDILVIDMNGNVVKRWTGFNCSAGGPARVLPGGVVIGAAGANPRASRSRSSVDRARFRRQGVVALRSQQSRSCSTARCNGQLRQHHDWQREDFPSGYYSPESKPGTGSGHDALPDANRIMLCRTVAPASECSTTIASSRLGRTARSHGNGRRAITSTTFISTKMLGPRLPRGSLLLAARVRVSAERGFDWVHLNSATYVGPNQWFDAGDKRFDSEERNRQQPRSVAARHRGSRRIDRVADGSGLSARRRSCVRFGQVIGQHHAHLHSQRFAGRGQFDGVRQRRGERAMESRTRNAPKGSGIYARPTSRVLEIDPATRKLVWSYTATGVLRDEHQRRAEASRTGTR